MTIHPTAVIDPSARIGEGTTIGPYSIIGPDVVIGRNGQIGPHVVLEYTTLGDDCKVGPFASIGLPPQHFKYNGEKTRVVAGDRCTFREGVTVHRGTVLDKGVTTIGNDCYLMATAHLAHDVTLGNNVTIVNGTLLAGHVQVGDNVFISGLAAVHQFARIGKGAIVSGGTMAVQDVAPFCIAQGDRATLRGLNVVGMRRMGVDRNSLKLLKDAYKTVFLSGLGLKEALDTPALTVDNPHVKVFRDFLATPKRGFSRPPKGAEAETVEEEAVV